MTRTLTLSGGLVAGDPGPMITCRGQLLDQPHTVAGLLEPQSIPAVGAVSIEVEHLAKHYGEVHAVDGISFTAREGEILGLLGHNGAGKTTTIRMLTGRARPTSGGARVCGYDVVHEREHMKPLINLVFEDHNLYVRLSGRENLQLFADLYGVSRARADELLQTVGLGEVAGRKVKTYSSGMKQRLLVARALINRPRVLFLDEPTRGLDPTSAREVRAMVRDQAEQGTAVFLTTHYMEEADELCDRVAFLSWARSSPWTRRVSSSCATVRGPRACCSPRARSTTCVSMTPTMRHAWSAG